jgi:hypothetical protein
MKTVSTLYKEELKKAPQSVDPYRAAVFNLVGLVDRRDIATTSIPQSNFDDFLWANVWFIQVGRALSLAKVVSPPDFHSPFGSRSVSMRSADGAQFTATEGEHDFLELIYAFGGAEYFDEQRNSPFKYALLLLACHRFGDAVMYLWQADKVFFASHLLVLCLYYGLVLPHTPLHCNPEHPLINRFDTIC